MERHHLGLCLSLAVGALSIAAQLPPPAELARVAGEPHSVSAAGTTRSGARLTTIENPDPFSDSGRKRLVVIADDERAAAAVVEGLRWLKIQASPAIRSQWAASVLLLTHDNDAVPAQQLLFPPIKGFFDDPEQPEAPYLWRWTVYQAPDVLIQVRGGDTWTRGDGPRDSISFALSRTGSELGSTRAVFFLARQTDGPQLIRHIVSDPSATQRSPLHTALLQRAGRDPLAVARLLAGRYPQTPAVSYIPSVAWINTLRLADITKDEALRKKVLAQMQPWLTRERPLLGDRPALTAIAGGMIYADLARRGEAAAADLAAQAADAALKLDSATGFAQFGQGWTDDMFMTASILARSGRLAGRQRDLDHAARVLTSYAGRLQRPDGLFVHFTDGRIAWGRGNGFAALGLAETLSALVPGHPARTPLIEIFRRHMQAMRRMQAPDGMWRQVVDEPGSYREESVTAMALTAMARGVRLGWLDSGYRPVIARAWRALAAHIGEDGAIVDVCTSTGSGPSLRFYLDRPALSGFDDRGGAMALMAAMEMYDYGLTF